MGFLDYSWTFIGGVDMALLEWIWGLLKRLLDFVKSILSLLANLVTSLVGWVVGFCFPCPPVAGKRLK